MRAYKHLQQIFKAGDDEHKHSDKGIQKRGSLNLPGENQKQSHGRPKF